MASPDRNLFGELGPISERTDDLNSYLKVAYRAILIANRPLRATEILETAEDFGFLPDHLFGATQHKTLNARLSEHILEKGSDSLFFRTAPGTYFLSDLAERMPTDNAYRVFHGVRRSKEVQNETVLVCEKADLSSLVGYGFAPYDEDDFRAAFENIMFFKERIAAERDDTVKQFVTFTIFHYNQHILVHRRGRYSTASERLKGAYSVGFGGHVNSEDFDLFNSGGEALVHNAARELWEELYLDAQYTNINEVKSRTTICSYINVDDTEDAQHHVAVLVKVRHRSKKLPSKGELSINELHWLDTTVALNDLSKFDLWSQLILENIYRGEIHLRS